MSFLSKIDWRLHRNSLIGNSSGDTKKDLEKMLDQFFIYDGISRKKFSANFAVLKHGSEEVYKLSTEATGEVYYGKYITPMVKKKPSLLVDWPIGYDRWFIAAYPDVVTWFQGLDEDRVVKLIGNVDETKLFNNEHKFTFEYLRKFVDSFKKEHKNLECF